jgi:hypothetical protein
VQLYHLRWDLLYLVEGVMLIGVSALALFSSTGSWRELYRSIFLASILYVFASEAILFAIARGTYRTGTLPDVLFLAALLAFLWVCVCGRRSLRDTQLMPAIPAGGHPLAPQLAKLALLSLPVMGYWTLFLSHEQPYLRHVRFALTIGGIALLAFVVFSNNIYSTNGWCNSSSIRGPALTTCSDSRAEPFNKPSWLLWENWLRSPPGNWSTRCRPF